MRIKQRRWLMGATAATVLSGKIGATSLQVATSPISKPRRLAFARDAGAHPEFKTEWWYITGHAKVAGQEAAYGFQITFFRSRVSGTQAMQSSLAAKQLLFAHAAITDVRARHLHHDQRIARWSGAAPGQNDTDTASASTQDTGVVLRDWSLLRAGADLHAQVHAESFAMDLRFVSTQAVLLQGDAGLSRKGPDPRQTSYYYSLPQLQVSGSLTLQGKALQVESGSSAWLDHEWSEEILPLGAEGWDWIGINLFDGSALTAFQVRRKDGAVLWDGGSFRSGSTLYIFKPGEVIFKPLRTWRSPTSRANYPVEWMVRTPADFYTVKAVLDNQELDSSNSTGAIYWEGLCEVRDSNSRLVGRGYLEMTGYAAPLKM
jgi:predicted secreted hydrolase